MRKILVAGITIILLSSCMNKTEQQAKSLGKEIFFKETTIDYGEIDQGSDGLYTISFKNLADKAIIVNRVRSSCGCTVPSWSKAPIEPGESGEIQVKYNTELTGSFMKSIYVYSSAANSPVKLVIKGKVVGTEKEKQ